MFNDISKEKLIIFRKLANILTLYRIFIVLPIISLISKEYYLIALILFITAGISDSLDGYFARISKTKSKWGAKADPIADKILIILPLILFVKLNLIPLWSVWLLITRELIISNWRGSKENGAPANTNGKIKTILQFISIIILWPNNPISIIYKNIIIIGYLLYWISTFYSIYSGINYLYCQSVTDQE